MEETYWDFYYDDELSDLECATQKELTDYADEQFEQECDDEGEKGSCEREIILIEYYFDDEGEKIVTWATPYTLEFEYYQGDFAEHNTMGM